MTPTRYGCRTCQRTDLVTTASHKLRKHTANRKRASDENPYCPGTAPVRPEDVQAPVSGGPGQDPAPLADSAPAGPQTAAQSLCDGCGHDAHTGECRELTMDGPPGSVDECGCLSPGDPNLIEDPSTAARAGARVHVIVPDDCPFGEGGRHEFAFGECGCGYTDPNYVAPVPSLAARVPVVQTGADILMGTGHGEADTDAMDALMAPDQPTDGSDKLYRNGRYALPDPLTGNKRTWTRATTMAETLSDLYSLNLWRIRMMLIGLARFPDMLDELREIDGDGEEGMLSPKTHRDILNRIGFKAQALAGSKVPASWGTEMHSCIERLSRGEITLADVPDKYRAEVTAWAAAMQEADLSAVPHLIERRVAVSMYGTAGTLDQIDRVHRGRSIRLGNRVIRLNAGDHVVGDLKSGRDLDYGWGEISIQMALYAHGAREGRVAVWNGEAVSVTDDPDDTGAWEWEDIGIPPKSIRTDVGVVMHVPVQRADGVPAECTLHWIDLEEGWKAVQLCESVRDWRKAKGLNTPFSIAEVATSSSRPVVRAPDWAERFGAVTTKDQARTVYRQWLASGGDPDSAETARLVKISKTRISQLTEPTA